VLCLLEGETCSGVAGKITKAAVETGVKGAGQDYLGAVKGAMSLAGQFAYPVCATMNGIDDLYEEAEQDDMMVESGEDFDHRMYDHYFL
jgi:hypothetical protein